MLLGIYELAAMMWMAAYHPARPCTGPAGLQRTGWGWDRDHRRFFMFVGAHWSIADIRGFLAQELPHHGIRYDTVFMGDGSNESVMYGRESSGRPPVLLSAGLAGNPGSPTFLVVTQSE